MLRNRFFAGEEITATSFLFPHPSGDLKLGQGSFTRHQIRDYYKRYSCATFYLSKTMNLDHLIYFCFYSKIKKTFWGIFIIEYVANNGKGLCIPYTPSHRAGGGSSYLASGASLAETHAHMHLSLGTLDFYISWHRDAREKSTIKMISWGVRAFAQQMISGIKIDLPSPYGSKMVCFQIIL